MPTGARAATLLLNALAGLDLPCPNTWGGGLAALVRNTISQAYFDDKARRWDLGPV